MHKALAALKIILNPRGLVAVYHLLQLTREASRDAQLSQEESDRIHAAVWDVIEAYR